MLEVNFVAISEDRTKAIKVLWFIDDDLFRGKVVLDDKGKRLGQVKTFSKSLVEMHVKNYNAKIMSFRVFEALYGQK